MSAETHLAWPVVHPDPDAVFGHGHEMHALHDLRSTDAFLALVRDLDAEGIGRMQEWAATTSGKARLLVSLYLGCVTSAQDLAGLLAAVETSGGRLQVRLLPRLRRIDAPGSALWSRHAPSATGVMTIGHATPITSGAQGATVATTLVCSAGDADRLARWFDGHWKGAVPLTNETAALPFVQRLPLDERVRAAWEAYMAACGATETAAASAASDARAQESPSPDAAPGPKATDEGGETASENPAGSSGAREGPTSADPAATAAAFLDLPPRDALAERVASILSRGVQVRVLDASRPETLTIPLSARLFGVDKKRSFGAVTRRTSYVLQVLGPKAAEELQARRRALTEVLQRYAVTLGGSTYWTTPDLMQEIEKERLRLNDEGSAWLSTTLGMEARAFAKARIQQLQPDIVAAYAEFRGTGPVPPHVVEAIEAEMVRSLQRSRTRFLPELTEVTPLLDLSPIGRGWGYAADVLQRLARFVRTAIARGWVDLILDEESDAISIARQIDVADDHILHRRESGRALVDMAKRELADLSALADDDLAPRDACAALLDLMAGVAKPVSQPPAPQESRPLGSAADYRSN